MQLKHFIYSTLVTSSALLVISQQIHASPDSHSESATGHDSHRHTSWTQTPSNYQKKLSNQWGDLAAIERGQTLYKQNCVSCHGSKGKGNGSIGKTLVHPPADLTNHFHLKPGDGDAYLFWRVSEGGMAEPFKSMKSAMPAFKNILNETERWDVLAYVHTYFHLGLSQWDVTEQTAKSKSVPDKVHDHANHKHN